MVNAGARPHAGHPLGATRYSASASRSASAASSSADGVTTTTITSQPRIVVVERSDCRTFAVSCPGPQIERVRVAVRRERVQRVVSRPAADDVGAGRRPTAGRRRTRP